ncbi:TetR/AcrR family transcriptional regulator [Nocardia farcinica]|nr:TetR/AcrR family transcriptional regulator [Nocardia farcinica]MBF6232758.1 TetR/AcrR family transcriptional regulator [Nocardia farcinica]MBF6358487.1 TetR/AcrR family transcriptional regulator [Nocardia farcinica]MBF6383568.1 TetR/AcrR family transcriptional regulator [Nocardia farcinica]MBF6417783.1 TetR/AcrR family transcriptional regulator [Nocardia farcinica]
MITADTPRPPLSKLRHAEWTTVPNPAPRRRGRPVRLDRETILAATDRMLSTDGAANFSMRRLAAQLEVSTAAIYHHFPTKGALFFAVLDARADDLRKPDLPADPTDRLVAIVGYLIDTLHELPWVVDILVRGETYGRAAMWILDEFVGAARALGATETDAVYFYSVLWRFTLGELTARRAAHDRNAAVARGEAPPHWTESAGPDLLDDFPSVVALLPQWTTAVAAYDTDKAIRAIVDGLVANLDSTTER